MKKWMILLGGTFAVLCLNAQRSINIDFNKAAGPLNTMFKECVGAGRAHEGLRADWQQQLAYVKKNVALNISGCTGCLPMKWRCIRKTARAARYITTCTLMPCSII